jgi:hypothetical protein
MPYTIEISATFPTKPGLTTVGYTPEGMSRVSTGIVEDPAGSGNYVAAAATFPDGWSGVVTWDTGTSPPLYAYETVNPPAPTFTPTPTPTPTPTGTGFTLPTAPAGYVLPTVFCSDEDVALRAGTDYPILVPPWQLMAQGTDGVFGANFPWILSSASVNFAAQGVHARQVVHLTGASFGSQGQLLAVDGVSTDGTALNLRRLGRAPGQGQPPVPVAGLSSVAFKVVTFDPQIDMATYDVMKIANLDGYDLGLIGQTVPEPREVLMIAVLFVLRRAYAIKLKKDESDLALKLREIDREIEELRGRLVVHFGALGQGAQPSTAFMARVRR